MRTPLAQALQASVAAVAAEERRTTRRTLLRRAGAGAVALAALGRLTPAARAAASPRIVVVGAGLAGLTCAYRLRRAGYVCQVFDASGRVGGRCWTIRDAFADGQIAEHGGELIDQGHNAIRNLSQELHLELDNLLRAEVNGTEMRASFDGALYTQAEITDDLKRVWQTIHEDVSAAGYPTLFDSSTQRGRELDRLSIVDWIEESVPDGMRSRLGRLLDVAYTIEYGADSSEQSALNLLYLLGFAGPGQLRIFGKSNEKYHVRGGNDQIPARLAEALAGQITTGAELVADSAHPGRRLHARLRRGQRDHDRRGGRARARGPVLHPPEVRRSDARRVLGAEDARHSRARDGDELEAPPPVRDASLELARIERRDVCRRLPEHVGGHAGTVGSLGHPRRLHRRPIGASFGSGTLDDRASLFLKQLEPVLPGISARWNRRATLDYWPGYEWTRGSYSYWKVGQYTPFAGIEGRQEGNATSVASTRRSTSRDT